MRFLIYIVLFLFFNQNFIRSQWQQFWSSSVFPYTTGSGWINFEKNGDGWKTRFYTLDSLKFQIMTDTYSQTPEFTYTFNESEKLAGLQIYSLQADLDRDNITEFYVLSYYGTASLYRQSFKIFNITNNNILLEKNDPLIYFSYPILWDLDGDSNLECLVVKYDYPLFLNYSYEIYNTGTTGVTTKEFPKDFLLNQNFPNPFNPSTKIVYSIKEQGLVQLKIYDVKGELIKTLVNEIIDAGTHEALWDGTNDKGVRQATGVYFYELTNNSLRSTKKMVLLR